MKTKRPEKERELTYEESVAIGELHHIFTLIETDPHAARGVICDRVAAIIEGTGPIHLMRLGEVLAWSAELSAKLKGKEESNG